MTTVKVGTLGVTVSDLVSVARNGARVKMSPSARDAITRSAGALESLIESGVPIYGLTTGVGSLDGHAIPLGSNARHQASLLRSHAAGIGPRLDEETVRAMMLARVATLCRGMSGVRLATVEALLAMINRGVTPVVPSLGSVGASDLAPLAHAGLLLIGEGRAWFRGDELAGSEALAQAGIETPVLGPRDGLAMINGLALTVGAGALATHDARHLLHAVEAVGALGLVALDGGFDSFQERSVSARPHRGPIESARRIRCWVGGNPFLIRSGRGRLREPMAYRTLHQTSGTLGDAIDLACSVIEDELRSASDNPLVGVDGWTNNNVGNFDGHRIALALDGLNAALIGVAAASERRTALLLDPSHNRGLPAFLVHPDAEAGVSSGLMLAQYTAAAIVAELRIASAPVSGQTIPTCNGTEDVVSMAPIAARRLQSTVARVTEAVACELVVASQASDLRGGSLPPPLESLHQAIRERVPLLVGDRVVGDDLQTASSLLRDPSFVECVESMTLDAAHRDDSHRAVG